MCRMCTLSTSSSRCAQSYLYSPTSPKVIQRDILTNLHRILVQECQKCKESVISVLECVKNDSLTLHALYVFSSLAGWLVQNAPECWELFRPDTRYTTLTWYTHSAHCIMVCSRDWLRVRIKIRPLSRTYILIHILLFIHSFIHSVSQSAIQSFNQSVSERASQLFIHFIASVDYIRKLFAPLINEFYPHFPTLTDWLACYACWPTGLTKRRIKCTQ